MRDFRSFFLEKKDRRKNDLFLIVKNSENQSIPINILMQKYQYTRKTLYADLAELKEDLIQVYQEDLLEKTMTDISLRQLKAPILTSPLIIFYINHSRNFQLFDMIVHQEVQTFEQLQSKITCSQSFFYKYLKDLNGEFTSLGVTFSLLGIEGEEYIIRHILFTVYWNIFGGYYWPFSMEQKKFVNIVSIDGFFDRIVTEFEREKSLFWLAIVHYRLDRGKTIPLNYALKEITPKWFRIYLTMSAQGGSSLNKDDEYAFLSKVLQLFSTTPYWPNQERLRSNGMIYYQSLSQLADIVKTKGFWPLNIQLEERLLEHARKKGWEATPCQNLAIQFSKIRYYLEENLIEWCHWLEPECLPWYLATCSTFEKELQVLFNLLPKKLASLYALECQELGLSLSPAIRIRIHAKNGKITPVKRLLDKYEESSIEIDQGSSREVDILFTDLLSEYQVEHSLGKPCVLYDIPLIEETTIDELRKIIDSHDWNQKREIGRQGWNKTWEILS